MKTTSELVERGPSRLVLLAKANRRLLSVVSILLGEGVPRAEIVYCLVQNHPLDRIIVAIKKAEG